MEPALRGSAKGWKRGVIPGVARLKITMGMGIGGKGISGVFRASDFLFGTQNGLSHGYLPGREHTECVYVKVCVLHPLHRMIPKGRRGVQGVRGSSGFGRMVLMRTDRKLTTTRNLFSSPSQIETYAMMSLVSVCHWQPCRIGCLQWTQ